MRISRQRAERRVQVYNIGAEYDDRTEFELSREEDGKYSLSYQFVASGDMGNEEDEDFTKKGEIATGATESMTARELYFFMNGVWAAENKATAEGIATAALTGIFVSWAAENKATAEGGG